MGQLCFSESSFLKVSWNLFLRTFFFFLFGPAGEMQNTFVPFLCRSLLLQESPLRLSLCPEGYVITSLCQSDPFLLNEPRDETQYSS